MATDIYHQRRQTFCQSMAPDSIGILRGATLARKSQDSTWPFRQDRNFYYLTGLSQPDLWAVFSTREETPAFSVFCRPRNPEHERWDGPTLGPEEVAQVCGAEETHPLDQLDHLMIQWLNGADTIYISQQDSRSILDKLSGWMDALTHQIRAGARVPQAIRFVDPVLGKLRVHKNAAELATMRKAAQITIEGHLRAMKKARPGLYEYELAAELDYTFSRHGCSHAYDPIVGSGPNACVLHHVRNDRRIEAQDLILIDAGAEYQCYASDITRTFPACGTFTREQQAIYEIVLAAQEKAIAVCHPDSDFNRPHQAALEVIIDGLLTLGLLRGDAKEVMETQTYRRFYMHRTSHWLGLDVHDAGVYQDEQKNWVKLQPGMVLTIEPGIYISADESDIDPMWKNIGVRIEDDICITPSRPEVITADMPKDITALCALIGT